MALNIITVGILFTEANHKREDCAKLEILLTQYQFEMRKHIKEYNDTNKNLNSRVSYLENGVDKMMDDLVELLD